MRLRLAFLLAVLALAASCGSDDGEQQGSADPNPFTARVDHSLVPLSSVPVTIFEGREEDTNLRVESRVLERTHRVGETPVAVVEVKEYEDGDLVERTLDYYAQHENGSVWYFGEKVDDYEDGKIVGHKGQWLAGEGNAKAGLFMPADPKVGQRFEQERAPGVAEDRSTVVRVDLKLNVAGRRRSDCIKTRDFAPLDNVTEHKYYCPGVGLVREEGPDARLELVRYVRR